MRLWMIAGLIMLGACEPQPPPVVYVGTDWRTPSGGIVTSGELEALRRGCAPPLPAAAPLDPDRPVPAPVHVNPAYRPGGEGLANASATGIASPDQPINLTTTRARAAAPLPVDECLAEKGLVRTR